MISSIAMDADNSFYVKSIATFDPTFFWYIISVLAIVGYLEKYLHIIPLGRTLSHVQ